MEEAGKIKLFKGLSSKEIASRLILLVLVLIILSISTISNIYAFKLLNKPFPGFLINQRVTVALIGRYHWTGTKAGLKYPDKILKANGITTSTPEELMDIVKSVNVGDPITYSIDNGKQVIEVPIPTMLFTWTDLSINFGIPFTTGICYLLIGLIVFILKPDTKVSFTFLAPCLFLSLYSITIFDVQTPYPFGFLRIYLFAMAYFPAAFVHFSLYFPEPNKFILKHPRFQIVPYIVSTILIIPLEFFYPDAAFIPYFQAIFLYIIVAAIMIMYSVIATFLKTSSVLARQRAKVILFGASLAFPFPAVALGSQALLGSFFGILIQTNFLTLLLTIFPASIAFAIARHNLFDVDVYIKRAVGYIIMTVVVGSVYFSLQLLLRNVILKTAPGSITENVYPIIFALFVVFLFNPINRRVQEVLDRLFYRKKFDYKGTVLSVSNALTSVLNIDEIVNRIIHTLKKEMFIDRSGVILMEQEKECKALFIGDAPGGSIDSKVELCLPYDDPLIELINTEKRMITLYDIEEDPRYRSVRESCRQRFSEMGASVMLPLTYQDSVTGILTFGNKKSGHFYTREDIHLLETLTNQGAVAIENAKLAEQMKKEETVRTNLSRYLSPQIVDDIVKNDVQVNLGGDRKTVTVLFSDIRNFTSITESRPAEQLVTILNEYFTEMADIIFECQGSLDKYIGDALVAVFGSLIEVENPVQNAVQAAVKMMKRMPVLNERWLKEYGFSMQQGIGVNTGKVFLGNIGSPERMEFTVIGDTVNVSSRFSGLAKAGQILLTREAFNFMDGSNINFRELPPSKVKGKSEELEVFEVIYS
jgi:class 3 adenylate cyclase/energy-converting hydrogenase Eha subunit A